MPLILPGFITPLPAIIMKEVFAMYLERLTNTIIEILRIPSTSGHEELVRSIFATTTLSVSNSLTPWTALAT